MLFRGKRGDDGWRKRRCGGEDVASRQHQPGSDRKMPGTRRLLSSLSLPLPIEPLFSPSATFAMSFFEVPGWSVPSAPTLDTGSRKRKRPQSEDANKLHGAEVNFEKLIKKLDTGDSKASGSPRIKSNQKSKKARDDDKADHGKNVGKQRTGHQEKGSHERPLTAVSPPPQKHKSSKKAKKSKPPTGSPVNNPSTPSKKKDAPPKSNGGLTALQSNMKSGLDGARFR